MKRSPLVVAFPFERVFTPVGFVLIPKASVTLCHGGRRVQAEMIVDTGADLTLIPYSLGKALGFTKKGKPIRQLGGVTGGVPYVLQRVGMLLGTHEFSARIAWALVEEVPLLLGRLDVFSRFTIVFDERREVVSFWIGSLVIPQDRKPRRG